MSYNSGIIIFIISRVFNFSYKKKNITLDTDVSILSSKNYPIISDFHNEIIKELDKAKNDKRVNDDNVKSLEKIEAIVRRL